MDFISRFQGIGWGDTFSHVVLWTMVTYLTDVWGLGINHAAMIINLWKGSVLLLPLAFTYIAETLTGNFPVVLLSNLCYMLGLGLLWMSTPPVTGKLYDNCRAYKPECVGHEQKQLLYSALPLLAVGMASFIGTLAQFFMEQMQVFMEEGGRRMNNAVFGEGSICCRMCSFIALPCAGYWITLAGFLVVTFVKPWATRFGICAIFGVLSFVILLSGVGYFKHVRPVGSPFTTIFRVLVAASSKMFYKLPKDANQLYERQAQVGEAVGLARVFGQSVAGTEAAMFRTMGENMSWNDSNWSTGQNLTQDEMSPEVSVFGPVLDAVSQDALLPHTKGRLRCLEKAAIILPGIELEQQVKNRWRLCRVTEVETAKIFIRMIPMWMTFIISGIVSSVGDTYFLEQANKMNPKLGRVKVPLIIFLFFHWLGDKIFSGLFLKVSAIFCGQPNNDGSGERRKFVIDRRYIPAIGIVVSMVFSILCVITAAKVEERRLEVIRSHDLLDKPNERIPMTMFWLVPQFVLLGALDGIYKLSVAYIFADQVPPAVIYYVGLLSYGVLGVGRMGSVLSVYVVGKISKHVSGTSWFQKTLNLSRLDNYFWVLAALSAVNLGVFIVVAIFYRYKAPISDRVTEVEDNDVIGDDKIHLCCC